MPINPLLKPLYPKNWKSEIRPKILERKKNCCKNCQVADGQTYIHKITGETKKVILTVAHLDHDPRNNEESNLAALCQTCHNRYDAKHRVENRRRSTLKKKGTTLLFEDFKEATKII